MARNLIVNGVTYNNVEALEMTDENGEKVLYAEGGGVELPELTNPAAAEQIVQGYEAIDSNGAIIVGKNPYEMTATNETVAEQSDLIGQIAAVLKNKAAGDSAAEDGLVTGELTEYKNERVTSVRTYAFYSLPLLTEVEIPNATSIGTSAFQSCTALSSTYFPEATSIGANAFQSCSALSSTYFPEATSIGANAFQSCSALKSVDFPKATSIGNAAFRNCAAITSINLPNATSIGSSAFQNNMRFSSLDFPKVKTIASSAFQDCRGIKRVNIPMCTSIAMSAFYICQQLETVIISQSEQVCSLGNTNVFSATKISSGTGYIYVPAALIEDYKVATNWSTYAAQFRAIEDYPEIVGG